MSVDDSESQDEDWPISARPEGALALVGAWREVGDREIDSLIEDIYAERERDNGRPVELEI